MWDVSAAGSGTKKMAPLHALGPIKLRKCFQMQQLASIQLHGYRRKLVGHREFWHESIEREVLLIHFDNPLPSDGPGLQVGM